MTKPTDVLRDEHRVILNALGTLEAAAERLDRGLVLPDTWWTELIAWLRAFADRNHHAKEERLLFPALVRAGVPEEGGPIGVMLAEHVEGRSFIQAMEAATDPRERAASARRYVQLLRAHIDKENGVLFPLADGVLDDAVQRALARDFQAVADELGHDASPAYAESVLGGLAAAIGTTAPVGG